MGIPKLQNKGGCDLNPSKGKLGGLPRAHATSTLPTVGTGGGQRNNTTFAGCCRPFGKWNVFEKKKKLPQRSHG